MHCNRKEGFDLTGIMGVCHVYVSNQIMLINFQSKKVHIHQNPFCTDHNFQSQIDNYLIYRGSISSERYLFVAYQHWIAFSSNWLELENMESNKKCVSALTASIIFIQCHENSLKQTEI